MGEKERSRSCSLGIVIVHSLTITPIQADNWRTLDNGSLLTLT